MTTTILGLAELYAFSVGASKNYRMSLSRTARRLTAYGLETICQLDDEKVNKFLGCVNVGQTTRHNYRREIMTLWRFAYEQNLTDRQPGRVQKIRPDYAPPTAWSPDELRRMIERAREDRTLVSAKYGVTVADLMPCWLLVGYDTAARFSDIHESRRENFVRQSFVTRAAKTGKLLVASLRPGSLAEAEALLGKSPNDTLYRWCLTRRRAFAMWREFLDRHNFRGSSRWLRRTAATLLESRQPNMASRLLQHSHPQLAHTHYIDQTLLAPSLQPPAIC